MIKSQVLKCSQRYFHGNSPCPPDVLCPKASHRSGWWLVAALMLVAQLVSAQVTLTNLSEGFEGSFPGSWSVGDSNFTGNAAYWGQVNSAFGGEGTHSGSFKAYCAGFGYNGTSASPLYTNYMGAYMVRTVDLSYATNAQLSFWYRIPDIETSYDFARVFVDGTQIWSTDLPAASWTQATLSLNSFVGASRSIRFVFTSDNIVQREGWYLDDILVTATYPPPANDSFASATSITGATGSSGGTIQGATKEAGEPNHASNPGGASVWFRWTAPSSGTVTFNTLGTGLDTVMGVYTGATVNALTTIASNDDIQAPLRHSAVTFAAVAGTQYRIAVDGYSGVVGSYVLNWVYPVVNETVRNLSVTNLSSFLMDSDALSGDPAYNRESFLVSTDVASTNTSSAPHQTTYVLSYRLLDTNNVPHPLYDVGGNTNASYTCNVTNSLVLGALQSVTNTSGASLFPAARLNAYNQYTVEVRIHRLGVFTGASDTDGPNIYLHYTNRVSGDVAYNVIPYHFWDNYTQTYAIETVPGKNAFLVSPTYGLYRYDDFNLASPVTNNVTVYFTYELRNAATHALVPLTMSATNFTHPVPSFTAGTPKDVAYFIGGSDALWIEPVSQIDSVSNSYYVRVSMSCGNGPGQPLVAAQTQQTSPSQLLHFNGRLWFGGIETLFTSIANTPAPGTLGAGFVNTILAVDANSGLVAGDSSHTYGSGAALDVRLLMNGDAILNSGSVTLNAPVPDTDTLNNVSFTRGPITLSTSGARSDITASLPTGFGYTTNIATFAGLRRLFSTLDFSNVPLTQQLAPQNNLIFTPGGTVVSAEESKAVWLLSSSIQWEVAGGLFSLGGTLSALHVRFFEYVNLFNNITNVNMAGPDMWYKRANDGYYQALNTAVPGPVRVYANADGVAEMTTTFNFNNGNYPAHFPYGAQIVWTNAGSMTITRDLVTAGSLNGVTSVTVPYIASCDGCASVPQTNRPSMAPDNSKLNFTRDGGLVARGSVSPAFELNWGYISSPPDYAQRVLVLTQAMFHMPGGFVRGDQNLVERNQGASTILLTGVSATNLNRIERPISNTYLDGFADYAGMNWHCPSNQARSHIGDKSVGPYWLTSRSKYYARLGGVSGIHEALYGSFPSDLTLLGYEFDFTYYGLAYLDSLNVPELSRTQGRITIPYPSDFYLDFEKMTFTCPGGLKDAQLPGAGTFFKELVWWDADFEPLAMQFKSKFGGCDPSDGYLTLGVRAYASHVDTPLSGILGFQTNGNLIPKSFGLPGVDSRLKLPNSFKLSGPTNTQYNITPVADAYYSSWSNASPGLLPGQGFMNIAARMDVPFFEDLKVHIHTGCHTNEYTPKPQIWLAGGWPRAGSSNPDRGWSTGSDNFFTKSDFDPDNFGFPPGVQLSTYRNNSTETYHPRAQKLWLDVVDFDYSLAWSDLTRTFKSFQGVTNDLLVLKAQHEITYMDPANASLDFGIQYDGLPKISLANMVFNAVDESLGVAQSIANAAGKEVFTALAEGTDDLDKMLGDTLEGMLEDVFKRTIDPTIDSLYSQLQSEWNALPTSGKIQFPGKVSTTLSNYFIGNGPVPFANNVSRQLYYLADGAAQPLGALKELSDLLREITNSISAVTDTISETNGVPIGAIKDGLLKKTGADRLIAKNLATELVGQMAADYLASLAEPHLSNLMQEIEPTLQQITTVLEETRTTLGDVRGTLQVGQEFAQELDSKVKDAAGQISNVTAQASSDILEFFDGLNYSIDDPFAHYSADEIKQLMRAKLKQRFFGSDLSATMQVSVKQRVYDLDSQYRTAVDGVFQQLNDVIRNLIGQTLAELDNSINGFLGDLSSKMGSGTVDGHALINGDSLKMLRLDGHFQWKAPDEMELNAYLIIKEVDSAGSPGCSYSGGSATEVTLGAEDVDLHWISPDLRATVETKFTFQTSPFRVVGMAGKFEMTGELNFESFKIYKMGAAVAFGLEENYLSATVGIKLNQYDLSGGIFFGRTCTLDPIAMWDPEVASVLGTPPFTGAYVYGEGWIPISEALGIPATCLFNISAGVGAGAFFFLEGPTYGGKIKAGVLGEALCVVTIKGEVVMIGVKSGSDLTMKGSGRLSGKVGWCPFCIKFGKTVSITYKNGDWDVDF